MVAFLFSGHRRASVSRWSQVGYVILWCFFGPELLENKCLCEVFCGTDSSSVSFGPWPLHSQCALQMSGDTVEKCIVRFDLGIPPGGFVAVGGWVQERTLLWPCSGCHCAPWSVQAVTFPQSCWMRKCCVIVSFPSWGMVHRYSCSSGQAVAAKVLSSPFLPAAMTMRCSSVRKKFPSKMIPEMRPTSPT